MKYQYITIEREYGSGGTKIARCLAEECGVACYGREILDAVAQKNNISVEQIERYEESVTNSFLYTIFVMSKAQTGETDMLTDEARVYLAEQAAIRQLADKGPAVFLGHCASEALKGKKGIAKVFIHAGKEEKEKRIARDYQIPASQIELTRKYYDKKRANYYRANTMQRWDDYRNYDVVLDSSHLGIDGCVAILKGLMA